VFLDSNSEPELIVEPRVGRVALFTSGENLHHVERVTDGQRFVLAFWFTCDKRREFEIFLDGKKHIQFGKQVRDSIILQRNRKGKKTDSRNHSGAGADSSAPSSEL